MSYVVHKLGGGQFNPRSMCIDIESKYLFISLGTQISIYVLPSLEEYGVILSHKANISEIICSRSHLISCDESGIIYWHKFNKITVIENTPEYEYKCPYPIERLLLRGEQLFYIYFNRGFFWCVEYGNEESLFRVTFEQQQKLISKLQSNSVFRKDLNPVCFKVLDGFDISPDCLYIAMADKCNVKIMNMETKEIIVHSNNVPSSYIRFREHFDGRYDCVVYLNTGMMLIYNTKTNTPLSDHWHYACPNAVVFSENMIISGGFEGVITFFSEKTHRTYLPRMGISIEGLCLSLNNLFLAVVCDKNILALVDPSSRSVVSTIFNVTGDISFYRDQIISVRKPNLIQLFDVNSLFDPVKLQVSSFSSNVPVTEVALSDNNLITVETSGGKKQPRLSLQSKIQMNHKRSRANKSVRTQAYEKLLLHDRYAAMRDIKKLEYNIDDVNNSIADDAVIQNRRGGIIMKDYDAATIVDYSEIKIWSFQTLREEKNNQSIFILDQTMRINGKKFSPLSVHPVLQIFAAYCSNELQIWKKDKLWMLYKSSFQPLTPKELVWSFDGTILVIVFTNYIDLLDVQTMEVVERYSVSNQIQKVRFINEFTLVIFCFSCISMFDLRSLSEVKHIFQDTICFDACDDAFCFAIVGEKPIVVLYDHDNCSNWEIPTNSQIKHLHITRKNGRCKMIVVDEDEFIYAVDEFGIDHTNDNSNRKLQISIPAKKEPVKRLEVLSINTGHVKEFQELLSMPSHQLVNISVLASNFFSIALEKKPTKISNLISISVDVPVEENDDEIIEYHQSEIEEMRSYI